MNHSSPAAQPAPAQSATPPDGAHSAGQKALQITSRLSQETEHGGGEFTVLVEGFTPDLLCDRTGRSLPEPVVVDLGFTADDAPDEAAFWRCLDAMHPYDFCYLGAQTFVLNPPVDPEEVRQALAPVAGSEFRIGRFSDVARAPTPEEARRLDAGLHPFRD